MLDMTKVELKLISDADMYSFFGKGMGGGVSYITKIYSRANDKYINSQEPKQESKHIIYLDPDLHGQILKSLTQTNIAVIL